ncbi:oxidoreductase-like protein [Mytilinidion resinicola]|uniref:Oxidoreductase-like protein n=1 Tax=Mytilinidion resinicola TaxID=574789 RepID=A0A6A6YA06_9PEZI|nr:oxidoreductase-like protein [Mytilinidion resinicola]KAF2805363.1 oxidoreductase-like protein [Mytilinidion resinicola]
MTTKAPIGFCGLGAMGMGMATHLVKSGHQVKGFDLYPPSLQRFEAAGGNPSPSLLNSAADMPFYIVMVATAVQAQSALFGTAGEEGIVHKLPQGAVLLLCSTVPASYAVSVERELKEIGRGDVFFIDSPVSGGAFRAADGTLSIMAGGRTASLEKGMWLLKAMSAPKKLFIVKGGIGAGSNMKMAHQVLAAIQILVTGEAYGFAARLGLDADSVRKEIVEGEAWSWMVEDRGRRVIAGLEAWRPGVSALTIILKDTSIITSSARLCNFPVPMASAAEQVYFSGLSQGFGSEDDAGMVRVYYPGPVADVKCDLDKETKAAKLKLVVDMLIGIYVCATAESIAFAQQVNLPLDQLHELAVDAAGGSHVFRDVGAQMIKGLTGDVSAWSGSGKRLDDVAQGLSEAANEAQSLKCPAFLTNAALSMLTLAKRTGEKDASAASVVKVWKS